MSTKNHHEPRPAESLYTPEEAASVLGKSRTFIYDEINAGRLRSVKVGRSRRIVASDLSDYIRDRHSEPPHGSAS